MKTQSAFLMLLALTAGCHSIPRGDYRNIGEFRHSEALAASHYHTPFATEVVFVVELIAAYHSEKSQLPTSGTALEEFSRHHGVSEPAIEFLKKNLVLSVAQQRIEGLCWDLSTRKHWIIAASTGEFRVTGEVYGTGSSNVHLTHRDGYSSDQFVPEVKRFSNQPNKAPEPTPTAVTSRAIGFAECTIVRNARLAPAAVVAHL